MRITFLGTGASFGTPVIGCSCAVCRSPDPRNRRNRIGVWLHDGPSQSDRDLTEKALPYVSQVAGLVRREPDPSDGVSCVIDVSSDFRHACLANGLKRVDFTLLTHPHSDHISGLDDLRTFTLTSGIPMPIYADKRTLEELRVRYAYAFNPPKGYGGGIPRFLLREVDAPFIEKGWRITPLPVMHGPEPILGYRVNDFAMVTDVTAIPDSTLALLENLDVLALDCLWDAPHSTHLSFDQAVAYALRIKAKRTYLIHLTHDLDHAETGSRLPPGIHVAYDGLTLETA